MAPTNGDPRAVGYRRPPRATQFKPGQSGNPKGRPKGSRNIPNAISAIFRSSVVIRAGNKSLRVSRLEALMLKEMELAFKGDQRAVTTIFKTAREFGMFEPELAPFSWPDEKIDPTVLTDEELAECKRLLDKMIGKNAPGADSKSK
jgi:uncharacterized protein DUF5681